MVAKQFTGSTAPSGARYCTVTDGAGNLITVTTVAANVPQQIKGLTSQDGARHIVFTDGSGNLV